MCQNLKLETRKERRMKISFVFLFYILVRKVGSNVSLVPPLCPSAHKLSTLGHQVNCILLLDYKLTLSKSNINNTGFMILEVFAMGV
jgi:hypothetical protein